MNQMAKYFAYYAMNYTIAMPEEYKLTLPD